MKKSDIVKVDDQKTQIVKKVKFPLGVKLAIIIGLVVLISLGTVTFLNSYFSGRDVRRTAEESNLSVNSRCAKMAENEILRMRASVFHCWRPCISMFPLLPGARPRSPIPWGIPEFW